jgi:hypothetical protein
MTKKKFNPFNEQKAGIYFVGREGQLELFTNRLSGLRDEVPNHLFLAGVHGTGKTSFIGRISEISKEHGFLSATTTLDSDKSGYDHIDSILRAIIKSLQNSRKGSQGAKQNFLKDYNSKENSDFFSFPKSDSLKSDIIQEDLETLQELIRNHNKGGVVICIDEGQRIEPSALSALKNSVQNVDFFLIVLSLRIDNTKKGIVNSGRAILDKKADEGEGDYGASRLFVDGIEIGSFESEQEAFECVTKRLNNNAIQFQPEIIREIVSICERIPRDIISLCSNIYNNLQEDGLLLLDKLSFNRIMQKIYNNEYLFIEGVCSSIPQSQLNILESLSGNDNMCIGEIAKILFPQLDLNNQEMLINATSIDVNSLKENYDIIKSDKDSYSIITPIYKFLIKLYNHDA